MQNLIRSGVCFVAILAVLALLVPEEVWGARAGGGFSSGSRGSRSFSSPSRTYSAPAPSPSPSTRSTPAPSAAPMAQPAPAGGFLRSMAGGILGGLLGGMLFSSLGFAGGFGGMGGGFGLMDMLLLAGIGYLIYWFIRRKRAAEVAPATAYSSRVSADAYGGGAATATLDAPAQSWQQDLERGLGHLRQMDPGFDEAAFREMCTDRFFRIQAAWMRRDTDKLRPLLTEEMQGVFGKQIDAAKAKRQINKLENITVRSVELTEAWQEQGQDYITVRLLANLLDYTVDEPTGKTVDGSDSAPVKFEEFWTWVRPVGRNEWRLSAINQAE